MGDPHRRPLSLRPDTVVREVGGSEVYVGGMAVCCLKSFKTFVRGEAGGFAGIDCECGRRWVVVSSLDERVAETFVFEGSRDQRRAG